METWRPVSFSRAGLRPSQRVSCILVHVKEREVRRGREERREARCLYPILRPTREREVREGSLQRREQVSEGEREEQLRREKL